MQEYGARFERGIVDSINESGIKIRSVDRPGIVSPPLKQMDGQAPPVGSQVWFCMTEDGQGIVIPTMVYAVLA